MSWNPIFLQVGSLLEGIEVRSKGPWPKGAKLRFQTCENRLEGHQESVGCGSKPMVAFWGGCTTHVWSILVGIRMFARGTIWTLTHGQLTASYQTSVPISDVPTANGDIEATRAWPQSGQTEDLQPQEFQRRKTKAPVTIRRSS